MFAQLTIAAMAGLTFVASAYGQHAKLPGQSGRPAATTIRYEGKIFPVEVDLSEQFSKDIPNQRGGFCHVFAATALLESACYRALGRRVDLSEGYYCYRHLRTRLSSCEKLPIGKAGLNSISGGDPSGTMDRFLSGSQCEEAQCTVADFWKPLEKTFEKHHNETEERKKVLGNLNDPRSTRDKLEALHSSFQERRVPRDLSESLDAQFRTTLKNSSFSSAGGLVNKNMNSDLDACRKAIRRLPSEERPSVERILSLLSEGVPFVCSGTVIGENRESLQHSVVLLGYRQHPTKRSAFEYLARDSNAEHPIWITAAQWASPCEQIDILTVKSPNKGE